VADQEPQDPISNALRGAQAPLRGRRWLSWLLFLSGLTIFLILPIAGSLIGDPASGLLDARPKMETSADRGPAPTLGQLDRPWSPGAVASGHQLWAHDCKACHSAPFQRVQDQACISCHRGVGDHVTKEMSTQIQALQIRCASCHQDHNGPFGLELQNKHFTQASCASCHADLKSVVAKTTVLNVKDFDRHHPDFRVQLPRTDDPKKFDRVRLEKGKTLQASTTLKFPHDVHLTESGVNSPKGKVKVDCASCHQPSSDKTTFQPVTFEKHCRSCHELRFEPLVSNREVPHGPVDQVLSTLREFYSFIRTNPVMPEAEAVREPIRLSRPGQEPRPAQSFIRLAGDDRTKAAAAATELFEKTSCVVCHEVSRLQGPGKPSTTGRDLPQWRISAIAPSHSWMPQARFNHAAHTITSCGSCHAAKTSKDSADVLMPAIATCRDCHSGAAPAAQRVSSDCGVCHGFHMPTHAQTSTQTSAQTSAPAQAAAGGTSK